MKTIKHLSRIGLLLAALALVACFYMPLWQILLWAPQYPEGLGMQIWVNRLSGDVDTINGLNHYIGMKHIEEAMFPEFVYLSKVLAGLILLGVGAALWGKKAGVFAFLGSLLLLGVWVMYDMYRWGYDYGHNLDPAAAIKVPGMSYQPPLLGYKELLNFLAYSGPDTGGWIMLLSVLLVVGVLIFEQKSQKA